MNRAASPSSLIVQDQFGITLGAVNRAWRAKLNARLRPIGGSSAQFLALLRLAEAKRGLVQHELAEALAIERPTLTRLLDRMEADGLVRRTPSATDRREKCIVLVAAARPLLRKMRVVARKLHAEVLEPFNEEELGNTTATLARLAAHLERLP